MERVVTDPMVWGNYSLNHAPSLAVEADRADFIHLREVLDVTDGNLSRHLRVLEDAGYVRFEKRLEGRRPRTWVIATPPGRRAFAHHLATLQTIISQVREAQDE